MADTLLIYFDANQPDTATWSLVNTSGELTSIISHGPLEDASAVSKTNKTVVLLDSACVHLDTVRLAIRSRQKLLRAIPYALEEHIADDVEDLHFVAGKASTDGSIPVAAIRHETLKNIISTLNNAGIEPTAIIPDVLCQAAGPEQWAVLTYNGQAGLQLGNHNGGKFDLDSVPVILASCLQQAPDNPPHKIILFTEQETGITEIEQGISEQLPETTELVKVGYNTHPLVVLCGHYLDAMPLNLLQDAYKPRSRGNTEWLRWRFAASLAVTLLVLHLGSAGAQYYGLQGQNEKLRVEIDNIYKKTFPESRRIVNARAQMEQKLNELKGASASSGDGGIISLLADSATALSSEKGITLQAINYRNNKIELELTSTNLRAIESLNKKLNQGSINSEITSSSSEKDLVKGNIRIKRPAS